MKKILVVGGGIAGNKFVRFLSAGNTPYRLTLSSFGIANKTLKLAKKYALECVPFDALKSNDVASFDCVIVCVPIDAKKDVTTHILSLGYKNALILEKPLAIMREDCLYYQEILRPLERYYVSYWRDFTDCSVEWIKNNKIEIDYASVFPDLDRNIIHNLPHLLNWLLKTNGNAVDIHINRNGGNTLYGSMNGFPMTIRFQTPDRPIFKVNNMVLPELNQQNAYCKMVQEVINYKKVDSTMSICNSLSISAILEEVLLS